MKVKELLTDESKWTQYEMARRADGSSCYPEAEHAVCWCLLGAIRKCYGWNAPADKIVSLIDENLPSLNLTSWNDCKGRKFVEVKAVVEKLDI